MKNIAKVLVPDKEWIIHSQNKKIGSVSKDNQGIFFVKDGKKIKFINLIDIESTLGIEIPQKIQQSKVNENLNQIYDFPCSCTPYEPIYDIKKKLPLFYKSSKSKSQYCAGYYIIKFQKRWVKSFCPKLITLDRYSFKGPYKTEQEIKKLLTVMNKL